MLPRMQQDEAEPERGGHSEHPEPPIKPDEVDSYPQFTTSYPAVEASSTISESLVPATRRDSSEHPERPTQQKETEPLNFRYHPNST
jgi:hypothetical protein